MNVLPSMRRRLAVGSVFLSAAACGTTAGAVDLLVITHSRAVAAPCAGIANCLDIAVSGLSDDFAGLVSPIPNSWSFSLNYRLIAGIGSGIWSYTDLGPGGNNLFGTSMHTSVPLSATLLKETVQSIVLGGGGIFAGAVGTGQSTAYINPTTGHSVDAASFSVAVVPEPSTSALMITGLLGAGALLRRRRQ